MFILCFLGTAFAGTVSTLMSVYLPLVVKDLLGDKNETELNHLSAYINSIFIAGAAIGGILCGILCDRLGRKPGVIIPVAVYALFTILTAYIYDWRLVLVCRFFSGFGMGGILVAGTTLVVEEWPSRTRAIFTGILTISFPIGIFSAGAIDYFVSSWRQAFLMGFIPLFLAAIATIFLKESVHWKQAKAAPATADVQKEKLFASANLGNLVKGSVVFGTMLIGLWALFLWIPTWIHTLIVSGSGQQERGLSMMMLGMGGLAGGFLSGWLMNAIGTRKSLLLCFGTCAVLSFILFRTNYQFSPVIYAEIIVLALAFGASQGVLSVYVPGLFPVSIRGTATGFCFNTGRLLTAAAVLFVGVLVNALGGYSNSLFILSLVFVIGFITTGLGSTQK